MKRNGPIDWAVARDRLEDSRQRLEDLSSLERDRDRAFRQRAEALAKEEAVATASTDEDAMVVLRAGKGLYGVPISCVAEVLTNIPVAVVPGAPARFAGVIQVRSEIRPVLYLLRALGISGPPPADSATVLLLRHEGREVGLLVDQVEDIRWVRTAERQTPPPDSTHVDWMTADMLAVLNVGSLLEGEA